MDLPMYSQHLFLGEGAAYRSNQFQKIAQRACKLAESCWYLGSSGLHGQGIFAAKDIAAGEVIGSAMGLAEAGDDGLKFRNLTTLARYCNHLPSDKANTEIKETADGLFDLVAKRDITADEELTADYADVGRKIGMGVGMRYGSEVMPLVDLSTFKQDFENESVESADSGDRAGDS